MRATIRRSLRVPVLLALLTLSASGLLAAQQTATPPLTLDDLIQQTASSKASVIEEPDTLIFMALTQGVAVPLSESQVQAAAVAQRDASSPRTDQQTGTSSTAANSTSVVDKPGLADFLNLAVEQGAVMKTTSATSYTLQTTPYLFYTQFGGKDDAAAWDQLTALRRIGLSATFSNDTATSSSASSSFNNFTGGELKVIVLGGRSARDKLFRQHVNDLFKQKAQMPSVKASKAKSDWFASLDPKARAAYESQVIQLRNWFAAERLKGAMTKDALKGQLDSIVKTLRSNLTPGELASAAQVVTAIQGEEASIADFMQQVTKDAKTFDQAGPQLSVLADYQKDALISDFSDFKVLFSYDTGYKLTATFNGDVAVNVNQTSSTGAALDRLRSYSGEAGLTFGRFADNLVDLELGGKVTKDKPTDHTLASLQLKSNLYLMKGITIPLSLVYANRTEDSPKAEIRFNVAVSLTGDPFIGQRGQ